MKEMTSLIKLNLLLAQGGLNRWGGSAFDPLSRGSLKLVPGLGKKAKGGSWRWGESKGPAVPAPALCVHAHTNTYECAQTCTFLHLYANPTTLHFLAPPNPPFFSLLPLSFYFSSQAVSLCLHGSLLSLSSHPSTDVSNPSEIANSIALPLPPWQKDKHTLDLLYHIITVPLQCLDMFRYTNTTVLSLSTLFSTVTCCIGL